MTGAKDTRETDRDEIKVIELRRPTPACILNTERLSSSHSTAKVSQVRVVAKEKEDERLPTAVIELRMATCSRNGFAITGNSGHGFVDSIKHFCFYLPLFSLNLMYGAIQIRTVVTFFPGLIVFVLTKLLT